MPTPTQVYAEVAATYGNVDPADLGAVQRWYEEDLPDLPGATIERVLDELLSRGGFSSPATAAERNYPVRAPLPSLGQSKPARPPILAAGWGNFVRRAFQWREK